MISIPQKERVTVITSTHNRLESLKESVNSIMNQTYQNWEYFIVSDGYDSRVRWFIKSLNEKRIKYLFTLETQYVGYLQRNLALKFASGKYVFCVDDDNIIYSDYIEKMVNSFVSEDIGYVICQIKYDGIGILYPQLPFQLNKIDMLNYMVRTSLARRVKGWVPYDYQSDFKLISKISKISKGNFLPEVLGWHRTLPERREKTKEAKYFGILPYSSKLILPLLKRILFKFNIELDSNKPIKIYINRLIYKILCKIWLKF